MHGWLDDVLDGPVLRELTNLVGRLDSHAENDALGQKLLSLTSPGIPDVYQGTELWDDSLVDPDNRREVDYTVPSRCTEDSAAQQDSGGQSCPAVAACATGHLRARRLPPGAGRRCRLPITSWRSCVAMTCWSR